MSTPTIRLLISGAMAIIALVGALVTTMAGQPVPDWLVGVIGAAVGYFFGHVQVNGKQVADDIARFRER